jgi:hypothetical protein
MRLVVLVPYLPLKDHDRVKKMKSLTFSLVTGGITNVRKDVI